MLHPTANHISEGSKVKPKVEKDVELDKMLRFLLPMLLIGQLICFEINVDTKSVIRAVDENFVSVTIDTGIMRRHWLKFQPWLVT